MSNEPLREESEEDFERPRDPDEGDIGVDIVLKKLDKPFAELRLNALDQSHRLASVAPTPGISNWVQIGPPAAPNGQALFGNGILVTGRITSVAVDPTDARIIYIGAAQGGVWKTIDGGNTWKPTSDNKESIAIGALAIDPANHLVLYAGTGEANFSADSYYGAGILKTTDGGDTWTLVSNWQDPSGPTGGTFTSSNFARIAINPVTTTTIFAASGSGLFRSTDSGSTWIRMSNGVPLNYATDVAINPANSDIVYAAFREKGIYQTTNANATTPAWNKLTSGLPPATSGFRIRLSISPSFPQVVYALMSDSTTSLINKFYNTTDDGNTWNSIPLPNGNIGNQGFYNLNIAVDPNTPDIVYLCAISLWKASRDATTGTWNFTDIGHNIHVDHHALAFDPTNSSVIYTGNDGGIYKSNDGGTTWIDSINKGLCITQFEFLDQHPTSDAFFMAGTQDNGTEQFRNSPVFYHAAYGDGGYVAIDQTQPNNMIHGHSRLRVSRSVEGGKLGSWTSISGGLSGQSLFYPPIVFDRSNQNNVAFGGQRIFLDSAQGTGGWPISITLPNLWPADLVSAIDYVDSNLIYVGTNYGKVYRLVNSGGGVWTATAIGASPLPDSTIQDIRALPNDPNTVVMVMYEFQYSNIWRGVVAPDGSSAVWNDISGVPPQPVMPKIGANALEIEPSSPNIMYVGTDIGVVRTTDAGNSWSLFSDGLPNCAVFDMRLHATKRLLRVATHGRGMWERKLDTPTMLDTDIFVRDDLMETGRSPSTHPVTAAFEDPLHYVSLNDQLGWWMCADVKIDSPEVPPGGTQPAYQYPNVSDVDYLVFESKLQHRNPSRGNVAHVYVQIHNRGITSAKNVRVKILYHDATAGPFILPSDFWTAFPNDSIDTTHWVPIGRYQVIPSLSSTIPSILEWDWSVAPGLSDHLCILVVADSLDDPIPGPNQVFDVGVLVPTEKHVGLKNLHIVNPTFTTLYWTSFTFNSVNTDQGDINDIVIPPSKANGWKLGIIFQKINPPEQPVLNGITARNPTQDMLKALKQKIGSAINDYDTSAIYMVDDVDAGGSLTNVRIPPGGRLKSMLLFIRPGEDIAEGKVTIIQEQKEEEGKRSTTLGGSTFILKGLVGKLTRELKKRKQQKQKGKRVGKHK